MVTGEYEGFLCKIKRHFLKKYILKIYCYFNLDAIFQEPFYNIFRKQKWLNYKAL